MGSEQTKSALGLNPSFFSQSFISPGSFLNLLSGHNNISFTQVKWRLNQGIVYAIQCLTHNRYLWERKYGSLLPSDFLLATPQSRKTSLLICLHHIYMGDTQGKVELSLSAIWIEKNGSFFSIKKNSSLRESKWFSGEVRGPLEEQMAVMIVCDNLCG